MPNSKVVFFITNKGLNTSLCCQILTAKTKVYFFFKNLLHQDLDKSRRFDLLILVKEYIFATLLK